jgi:hypothetical protein
MDNLFQVLPFQGLQLQTINLKSLHVQIMKLSSLYLLFIFILTRCDFIFSHHD